MKQIRAIGGIYMNALLFNILLSIVTLLIPLYGMHLNLQASYIGLLLSLPAFFMFVLRLFGGILVDTVGEKYMLLVTFGITILSGAAFYALKPPLSLVIGQVFMGMARSWFWTAAQAYASQIPGQLPQKTLGGFIAFVNIGKLLGLILGGAFISSLGYSISFLSIAIVGIIGILCAFMIPQYERAGPSQSMREAMESISAVIAKKSIQFALVAAFIAGFVIAFSESFSPIWLKTISFTEKGISWIMVLRVIGSILGGAYFSSWLLHIGYSKTFSLMILLSGISLLSLPLLHGFISIALFMFSMGIGAGLLMVYYQVIVTNYYGRENIGITISIVGLAWSLAFFITPMLFGLLIDAVGISLSFLIIGSLLCLFGLFSGSFFSLFLPLQPKKAPS